MLDESIFKKYIQYCTVKLDIYNIPVNLIYIYTICSMFLMVQSPAAPVSANRESQ